MNPAGLRIAFIVSSCMAGLLARDLHAQKVLVTYYSLTGHTRTMAEAVARGARTQAGAEVRLLPIDSASEADLRWADAIIVGSPVQMASVAVPVMQAIGKWPFRRLGDKIAAVFVTGGGISSGEELTQVQLLHVLLMEGLIVVGGPEWSDAFGASGITAEKPFLDEKNTGAVDSMFLAKGEALGKRVAAVARSFAAGQPAR